MKSVKVDVAEIKDIVISHDHCDHTGGMGEVLRRNSEVNVYVCEGFGAEFKANVKKYKQKILEVNSFTNIRKNLFSTGAIEGIYRGGVIEEQSLVLLTSKGITIITGCAHPGIVNIVKQVKGLFPQERIYCVLGGFHLKDMSDNDIIMVCDRLKDIGVLKAGPAHCSGDKGIRIFEDKFNCDYIRVGAGVEIEV